MEPSCSFPSCEFPVMQNGDSLHCRNHINSLMGTCLEPGCFDAAYFKCQTCKGPFCTLHNHMPQDCPKYVPPAPPKPLPSTPPPPDHIDIDLCDLNENNSTYVLVLSQGQYDCSCDYSIGCGTKVLVLPNVKTTEEAIAVADRLIMEDYISEESKIKHAYLLNLAEGLELDPSELYGRKAAEEQLEELELEEAQERALLARLEEKYRRNADAAR